jgi:hypothetical protein
MNRGWSWLLLFLILIIAILVVFAPSQHSTSVRTFQLGLSNGTWAGYEVVPTAGYHATFVNASWTVPEVVCTQGSNISVLIWVGLGGQAFNTTHDIKENGLEQIGTRIDCQNGVASYSSWYELWPDQLSTMPLANIVQKPGDNVTASISYSNETGEFTFDLTSTSTPTSHPFSLPWVNGTLVSAEWIMEAPGFNYTQPRYVVPDFGNITFWNCFATVANNTESITGFGSRPYSNLNELSYICLNSTDLKAVPQRAVDYGKEFSITWVNGGTC